MKHLILVSLFSGILFTGLACPSASLDAAGTARATPDVHSGTVAGNAETLNKYASISPDEAYRRISGGERVVLLDVRTPEEFAAKRIPGSILIPVEPVDMVSGNVEVAIPDKNAAVFIYCRSGRRSVDAARILVRLI